MTPYILASASPRRREICALADIPVEILPAPDGVEPPPDASLSPQEAVLRVARAKAEAVANDHPDRIVIGADTTVWLGREPLGKPADEADAAAMLRKLSGNTHQVVTAVWVCSPQKCAGFHDTADVTFYPMSEEDIAAYIATGEPMDKAGAYGIQGKGMVYIEALHGDFYTVMGLSGAKLKRFLNEF
ncbi:MAG: septum formation protein Maf [Ruminococcaceae bacterium]|nr:septum formation protein Maf [Oscillospiraceae bacterium]